MNTRVKNARALALEWATAVGIPDNAKFDFAQAVLSFYINNPQENISISFGVHYNENGAYYLHAITNEKVMIIETVIPLGLKSLTGPGNVTTPTMEQLLAQNKSLEQSNNDLKQFTFSIAHDLKNSITKLKLAVSLLSQEELAPRVERYVQIIDRASQQMEDMTMRMNELIEIGHKANGVVKEVQLDKIFDQVYEQFQESLGALNASVDTDFTYTNRLPYVEIYLKSIFSNLISNSVKYASPDRSLKINVSARHDGDRIRMDFSDNGQGIDLGDQRKQTIFQPFTRFSDKADGKGLGLYIVKTMVERNGGHVEVESTPDSGTTFHFVLQPYTPD